MAALHELLRFTSWANERVIQACASLSAEQLRRPFADLYGTPLETLTHLISIEHNYLRLMRGEDVRPLSFDDVAGAAATSESTADGYREFIGGLANDDLQRTFHMPGLGSDLTLEQGIIQVTTHSTQHRADLASALTRLGLTPPPLDYVQFLLKTDPGKMGEGNGQD
jgi:uncharacterized damage-inducible protein DinB